MQENEIEPLSYTTCRNKLKMDISFIVKTIKFLDENIQENFVTLNLEMISWIRHQKHRH